MKRALIPFVMAVVVSGCVTEALPRPVALAPCDEEFGTIQPPATAPGSSLTSAAPPPAASGLPPAPAVDRVGFPEDYGSTFWHFYHFDRVDMRSIVHVCANETAASVIEGEPYPYGSVLVMENWSPLTDADDNLVYDSEGRLIRSVLNSVAVMRKEPGFGAEYGPRRSGEWEYVTYFPDGSYQTPPERSASCAACHAVGATAAKDFVFRTNVHFLPGHYGRTDRVEEGEIALSRMAYRPGTKSVPVGTTIVWRNSSIDETTHVVAAADASFVSGVLEPGETFSHTFDAPGRYEYTCPLHPEQMRGAIEVTE
jgi:plastocyanin